MRVAAARGGDRIRTVHRLVRPTARLLQALLHAHTHTHSPRELFQAAIVEEATTRARPMRLSLLDISQTERALHGRTMTPTRRAFIRKYSINPTRTSLKVEASTHSVVVPISRP